MAAKKSETTEKEPEIKETPKKTPAEKETKKTNAEVEKLKTELEKKNAELEESKQQYLRLFAEFDNFKKRSVKEKQQSYSDAKSDALTAFLPVIDNIERAISAEGDAESVKKGVELIMKQVQDVMTACGIEEINAMGATFDPNMHNAVMHVDDENYGEQEIIDVFQKGYKIGDKVVRYSVVKVAN